MQGVVNSMQPQPLLGSISEGSLLDPSMDPQLQDILNHQSMIFDDAADEFEVAEERANLFGENINAEILSYEQLLELQERIGFVNRGMKVEEMNKFP